MFLTLHLIACPYSLSFIKVAITDISAITMYVCMYDDVKTM